MTTLLLGSLLHLSEGSFGEVLKRLGAVEELSLAESGIGIEIHTSDNCDQKRITCVNAALDKETLEVARVDETEVAVVDVLVARVVVVVIACGQVLL